MNRLYIMKIIAASLLGDGCVHIPQDYKNALYSTCKTVNHRDYVDWLKDRLSTVTKVNESLHQPGMKNAKQLINISTRSHPIYTKFRNRMYPNGIKAVDPHYLKLMDWEFMAVWFQEDGTLHTRYRKNCYEMQASIATMCFTYGDHLLLARAIQEKLDIPAHIRAVKARNGVRQYMLTFRRKFIPILLDGISPYVAPSFQYKCSYDRLLTCCQDEEIVRPDKELSELDRNDLVATM